jgi:hypothetical protein
LADASAHPAGRDFLVRGLPGADPDALARWVTEQAGLIT